ncbi:MAG: O-antigen ligase family protein [Ethanoligenens sp.]
MRKYIARVRDWVQLFSWEQRVILCSLLVLFVPYPYGGIGVGLAGILTLILMIVRRKTFARKGLWLVPIWAALTLLVTAHYYNGYGFWVFAYFLLILAFGALVRTYRSDALTHAALGILAATSFIACAVAVVQVVFDFSVFSDRAASTMFNPNFYGFICELIALACVWAVMQGLRPRWLFWAAIPVNLLGIFLSGCRSAWLPVGAGVLLLLLLTGRKRAFGAGVGIGAVIGAALWLFPKIVMPRAANFDHSRYLRQIIWAEAWRIFIAHPIVGGGFLAYQFFSIDAGEAFRVHAHNLPLDMLVNFGVVGMLLLCAYCIPAMVRRAKQYRQDPTVPLFFAVLLATVIHGVTDVPLLGIQSGPVLMLLVAVGSAAKAPVAVGKRQVENSSLHHI